MKQKGKFVLRKLMDEYVLIPYRETAEQVNQVITLSEIAAYIYEHAPDVDTPEALVDMISKEYHEPKENIEEDTKLVLNQLEQMGLLEEI